MSNRIFNIGSSIAIVLSILLANQGFGQNTSELVFIENGELFYKPFSMEGQSNEVNTIPDFSHAGYQGGGVSIPDVPVKVTISPVEGSDDDNIQNAINQVAALTPDANGIRGAILLKSGYYDLEGSISIKSGGIVLRGEGQGKGGTVIHANLRAEHSVIIIEGSGSPSVNSSTRQEITTAYVPVGTYSFEIQDAALFSVGDQIHVTRTPNQAWISAVGMDQSTLCGSDSDCNAWTTGTYSISHERTITAIDNNTVTIDIPIVDVMEEQYGSGEIMKYTWESRIENSGVENLRLESFYNGSEDEDHAWDAILLKDVQNCWVKDVTGEHFAYSTVNLERASFNTIQDCAYISPKSQVTGSRRYSFAIQSGLGNLFQRCYASEGRHDFVVQSRVTGPNVFLDGLAVDPSNDIGPHQRWSTGTLFDNIFGGSSRVWNRGNSGTGHGWSGAQTMFWNVQSRDLEIRVDSPPGSINWGIGCSGPIQTGSGYFESWGERVLPRSLYLKQLEDRLGTQAVLNISIEKQRSDNLYDELEKWAGFNSFEIGGIIGNAPNVAFQSPSTTIDLSTWEETDVEVSASDSDGEIIMVKLLINGDEIETLTQAPFTFENVKSRLDRLEVGTHFLEVVAVDNQGNYNDARLAIKASAPEPINLDELEPIALCDASASSDDGNVAMAVIDGDFSENSRWSSEESEATLTVEACEARTVEAIGISWFRGDERAAFFDLETSLDEISWKKAYSGRSSGATNNMEAFDIQDSIKYVRYIGNGNSVNDFNSVIEIDFFVEKVVVDSVVLSTYQAINSLTIFPNPANDYIKVQTEPASHYSIVDMLGREITRSASIGVDGIISLRDLKEGVYFIKVSTATSLQTKKLVIRR